ncbi:hypothetical protein Ciccas_006428 [Cichlidogyrus casuarinus]|uniref:Uncharacterized protein n=1 Tax=Cichlidogyrus casuarinus TaxID=1844966 RepID=A0ABD2Q5T4_9PLAT
MTSIEFGGGASIEQRREFANCADRYHISGYNGFVPQFKYRIGKTFASQTAKLARELPYYNGPEPMSFAEESENKLNMLPKWRGDNKYFEDLIPGYSADIPGINFVFGAPYTKLCNERINEFVQRYENREQEFQHLHERIQSQKQLQESAPDNKVRDELNLWVDDSYKAATTKKPFTEPGIPGYQGFVPRDHSTDCSLGYRYTVGSERCLKLFEEEMEDHFENLKHRALPPRENTNIKTDETVPRAEKRETWKACNSQVGCIPRYTGYVPQFKYQFGHNFGEITRQLPHCSKHKQ